MQIFLSPLAVRKLDIILEYLQEEWGEKSKNDFVKKLKKKFDQISNNPASCKKSSKKNNLRKCLVTKQCSFYYRIINNEIEIITLIDNRQDPDKIHQELYHLYNT
jgi:plasmid stabilization system protein ParE